MYLKIVITSLFTLLFLSFSAYAARSENNTIKLYLSIESQTKVLNDVAQRRYQRMMLKKIVELGKHEFQIFDKNELHKIAITGLLLKINFLKNSTENDVKLEYALTSFEDGEKKNEKVKVLSLTLGQVFSSGIETIISELK